MDVVKSIFWFHKVEDFYSIKSNKFEEIVNWNYDKKQLQTIFVQFLLSLLTSLEIKPLDFTVLLSHEIIDELMELYLDTLVVPVYEGYELIREIFEVHQEDGVEFLKNLNKTPCRINGRTSWCPLSLLH